MQNSVIKLVCTAYIVTVDVIYFSLVGIHFIKGKQIEITMFYQNCIHFHLVFSNKD